MSTLRPPLLAALALACLCATAAATPLDGVTARYDGGILDVAGVIDAPPAASGCQARVSARWAPVGQPLRMNPTAESAGGLVTKTAADGGVVADTCQELGPRDRWTRGRLALQFRPAQLAAGRYRVCVRAVLPMRDGHGAAHVACGAFVVAPPRHEAKRALSTTAARA